MIKIKEMKMDFMHSVHIGSRCYDIEMDKKGFDAKIDDVVSVASTYNFVNIHGDEPFNQNKELSDLCRKLQKANPFLKIIIHTDGLIKPVGMNAIKAAQYIIYCKLSSSGISFDDRFDTKAINWFIKAGAQMVFEAKTEDDLEDIDLIISKLLIKKNNIYVKINDNFNKLMPKLSIRGFNIFVEYEGKWQ